MLCFIFILTSQLSWGTSSMCNACKFYTFFEMGELFIIFTSFWLQTRCPLKILQYSYVPCLRSRQHLYIEHVHATRLDVSTCQEYRRRWVSAASPSTVPQSAVSTAWQQPVTQHVSTAAQDPSVCTVMNATWDVVKFLCDSGVRVGYKCHHLLTYLLTLSHVGSLS